MLKLEQMPKGLVGRTKESKQLGKLFDESLEYGARIVLISGETGIGKTTLLEQLRGNVLLRDGYYLVCKSGQLGSPFPYHPLGELLRLLFEELGQSHVKEVVAKYSPRVLSELALLVPKFGAVLSGTSRVFEHIGSLPDKLFLENACSIVRDLLREKPVVLILEDIPYADPTSLEVLQYFLQHRDDFHMLICATYDLDDIDLANGKFSPFRNFIRALNYEDVLEKINLSPLTRDESNHFMATLLGEHMLPNDLVVTVYERSEGNPLVIKHLIQKLMDTGNLQHTVRGWEFSRPLEMCLPQEIHEMFLIRLEGIRPELRNVLSIAAVIGRKFSAQTLAQLLNSPLAEIIPFLEEALHLHLIEEHYDSLQSYFTFVSSRLQEVLYENLSYQRKMLLHQQVGLLLEQTMDFRTQPDEFAYHFQWGTDKGKAVKYGILAGQRAISLCAFHSAWRYFCNARDLFPLLDEEIKAKFRYPVLEGLAESASFLGYYSEARNCLGKLLGSGAPQNNRVYGSVQYKLGDLCFRMGNFPETLEHFYLALHYVDDNQKGNLTIRIIQTYLEMGHFDEAASLANLQFEREEKSAHNNLLMDLHTILTQLYIYSGEIDKALENATLLQGYQPTNEVGVIVRNMVIGQLVLERGQLSEAEEQFHAGLVLARKIQDPLIMGQLELLLARVLMLSGKVEAAKECFARVKSLNVFSHSFILQSQLLRQECLAVALGYCQPQQVLEEFELVWNGKTCSAFGAEAMATRVESLILAGASQAESSEALQQAKALIAMFPTAKNRLYLKRAEAAYNLKFTANNSTTQLLEILLDCKRQGLTSEALITAMIWQDRLVEELEELQVKMGVSSASPSGEKASPVKPQVFIPEDVLNVLNYIHEQYAQEMGILALCRIANLSERQLRRLFNQHIGLTINQYIANYRIERAKELLLNPTISIHQVGELVGIADKTHFCKTFKSITQMSPSEFRKRQLQSVRNDQLLVINDD